MENTVKLESKINWPELAAKATVISVCVAILGVSISSPLYLGSKIDNKIDGLRNEMRDFREKWAAESKDFHEKWAAESKDFHGRLCAIEERNKK
jgi:hypothetical protein